MLKTIENFHSYDFTMENSIFNLNADLNHQYLSKRKLDVHFSCAKNFIFDPFFHKQQKVTKKIEDKNSDI